MLGVHDSRLPCAPVARPDKHAGAEIDGCDIETSRVVSQIQSRAGGYFEHTPTSRLQQARTQAAEYYRLQRHGGEIIPPRCAVPLPLKIQQRIHRLETLLSW